MAPKKETVGQVTPAPVPAPLVEFDAQTGVRSTTLNLDADGYPGWWARVRLNPKTRDMLAYYSAEPETHWQGFSAIVLGWNARDESGELSLPSAGLKAEDAPFGLLQAINRQFDRAFTAVTTLPKG